MRKIAIITGTGLESTDITNNPNVLVVKRHGADHKHMPSDVPYYENILKCSLFGADLIIAVCAVGSLIEGIHPGSIVLPNQFIDWTRRKNTIFTNEHRYFRHVPMAHPFAQDEFSSMIESLDAVDVKYHLHATTITIEGPRFSTQAESLMYRSLGAHIIGMTTSTECTMANEMRIPYLCLAMVTDYDAWKDGDHVTDEKVKAVMAENVGSIVKVLNHFINKQ